MSHTQPRRWYLAKNKQRLGPFTAEQLRQMAAAGMIQHSDMTLEEGQTKWQVAGTIEGIWPEALPLYPPRPDAITCPSCKTPVSYKGRLEGKTVCCPRCKSNFKMQRNAASIPNSTSPKEVENVPTSSVPRKRGLWNRKTIGIVTLAVTAMILVLFISFCTIGNKEPQPSDFRDDRLAHADDPTLSSPGDTRQNESGEIREKSASGSEKTRKEPLAEKKSSREEQSAGGKKEEALSEPGADQDKVRLEDERKKRALEVSLRNAVALQAPPFGTRIDTFAQQMRKLATDEFAFQDAKKTIYKATFDQAIDHSPLINWTSGRNVLVSPGNYDFEQHRFTWQFYLWYLYMGQTTANGKVFPETWDYCQLMTTFNMDENTARKWRKAYDARSLRLTIWFKIRSVQRRSWVNHPHVNDGHTLAHDLVFDVETLRTESSVK